MKIDSKKLMIILLVVTALVLVSLLIYGGFSLGKPEDTSYAPDTIPRTVNGTTGTEQSGLPGTDDISAPDTGSTPGDPYSTETAPVKHYPLYSGRIVESNSALLTLVVDWNILSRTSDMATVKLTVKIRSYSLFVSERKNCPLTFLGQTYSFTAPAISYAGTEQTEFVLHEQTVTMPLVGGCGSAELNVSWNFRGEYAGVQIDTLTLDGFIEIKD